MIVPSARVPSSTRFRLIPMLVAAVLGACAPNHHPAVWDARDVTDVRPIMVRFDNDGSRSVDVYLIGERREWRLGRVVAGEIAKLEIPAEAGSDANGFVRLAVIEGAPPAVRAARDPRARFSIAEPLAAMAAQRFAFSEREAGGAQVLTLHR